MKIADLSYFEPMNSDSHSATGGRCEDTLFIDFAGGIFSLRRGDSLLFEQASNPPKKIVFSLEGSSFLYARTVSTTTDGKTKTTLTISTSPTDVFRSPLSSSWIAALF